MVESITNNYCNFYDEYATSFAEKIEQFKSDLSRNNPKVLDHRRTFTRIQKEHSLTNKVRHNFHQLSNDEAVSATYNFIEFCKICGFHNDEQFEKIQNNINIWDSKISPIDSSKELKRLEFELFVKTRENKDLHSQLKEYEEFKREETKITQDLETLSKELEKNPESRIREKIKMMSFATTYIS